MRRHFRVTTCNACATNRVKCERYEGRRVLIGGEKYDWLCEFCATTRIGQSLGYGGDDPLAELVCRIGHAILKAIKETRR